MNDNNQNPQDPNAANPQAPVTPATGDATGGMPDMTGVPTTPAATDPGMATPTPEVTDPVGGVEQPAQPADPNTVPGNAPAPENMDPNNPTSGNNQGGQTM